MAREALIELTFYCKQKNLIFLIDILCRNEWSIHNENGKAEYLPIGDDDDFCWQEKDISYAELKKIIEKKQNRNELIGVCLFHKDTNHGISILARELNEVSISIDINRRIFGNERDALTDFTWYFFNIITVLKEEKTIQFSYKFEDYID